MIKFLKQLNHKYIVVQEQNREADFSQIKMFKLYSSHVIISINIWYLNKRMYDGEGKTNSL